MENVHQRVPVAGDDDDEYVTDEDYAADHEDNGEVIMQPKPPLVDPGQFKYNRSVCVVAIPCLLLLLAVTGEMLLVMASFGLALILSTDYGGNNQRTLVIFMLLFIPSHILVLYSVLPLLWVSLLCIFLLLLINAFLILTGSWVLLQFSLFRKTEPDVCIAIEKMLFSLYPGICACLLTWALATIIPLRLAPFALTGIGFVFLQVFMAPARPSFKSPNKTEDLGIIVDHQLLGAIALGFCLLPTALQVLIGVYQLSHAGIFQVWFLIDLLFLLSVSVFLTTLMSIRAITESQGMDYTNIIRARWVSGALATSLCYPALLNLEISSHFLPWLPAAVALYSVYGVLLSYKKHKWASTVCLVVAMVFSFVWPLRLPWKLSYTFVFGLQLTAIYILLLVNAVLCMLSVYVASHGRQEVLSVLVILQTLAFVKCELVLFEAKLYGWPLILLSTCLATYCIQRLHIGHKLPQSLSSFCISAHVTKAVAVFLFAFVKTQQLSYINYLLLFCCIFMTTRVFVNEMRPDITAKKVYVDLVLLCLSLGSIINPVFFIFASHFFQVKATAADATALCSITCGVLIIIVGSMHLPPQFDVKRLGVMGIGVGILILFLQPTADMSLYSLFQWSELLNLILILILMSGDLPLTLSHVLVCSFVLGFLPGVRCALILYADTYPVVSCVICVLCTICVFGSVLGFLKAKTIGSKYENFMLKLCIVLVLLSTSAMFMDLLTREHKVPILFLPAWKLFLVSNVIIAGCMKMLSFQKYSEIIPLREGDKEEKYISTLPIIGNLATVMSFMLTCLMAPATGFLHDIYCCGACILLVCLQKDMKIFHSLRTDNQTAPTKMAAVLILVLMSIYRTRIWDASGMTFIRCVLEILLIFCVVPTYYVLWGFLWRDKLVGPEQVVVFLLPLNVPLLLYGSSYTVWAFALTGILSSVWMMSNKLPLIPYNPRASS